MINDSCYNKDTIVNVFCVFNLAFLFLLVQNAMCRCPINSKKNKNKNKKTSSFATCPIMLGAIYLTFSALFFQWKHFSTAIIIMVFFCLSFISTHPQVPPPSPIGLRGLCMVPNDQKYVTNIISEFNGSYKVIKNKNYLIAKMWAISNMN